MRKFIEVLETIVGAIILIIGIAVIIAMAWWLLQFVIGVLEILCWLGGGNPFMGGLLIVVVVFFAFLIMLFGF